MPIESAMLANLIISNWKWNRNWIRHVAEMANYYRFIPILYFLSARIYEITFLSPSEHSKGGRPGRP